MPQPTPRIAHYQRWLLEQRGLSFGEYDALWRWSTTDLRGFWSSIREYFDIESPTASAAAGVTWFGAGAAFYASCLKAGVGPMREGDLSRLRAAG